MTKKLLTFLTLLTLFFGVGWAAEDDVHNFPVNVQQLLNNNATIQPVVIEQQSYPIKAVTVHWRHNKDNEGVTIEVFVGGTSWGTQKVTNSGTDYFNAVFEGTSTTGAVRITFTNNTGSGTGHGTFYVDNVALTEGASNIPSHDITYATVTGGSFSGPASATEGSTVSIAATPTAGYEFGSWNVYKTGEATTTITVGSDNKFTMPTYDVTVSGSFTEKPKYGITVTGGEADLAEAYEGQTVTLTPTIPEGKVIDWDNTSVSPSSVEIDHGNYTFTMPGQAVEITFAFKNPPTYVFYEPFTGSTGTNNDFGANTTNDGNGTAEFLNSFGPFTTTQKIYGANNAIKTGKSGEKGNCTTPMITGLTKDKTYILTFKAAPWANENAGINVEVTGGTLSGLSTAIMTPGQWNDFSATFVASGTEAQFTFTATRNRFFLDEVMLDVVAETGYEIKRTIKTNGDASNEAGGWIGDWSNNCSYGEVSGNHYTVTAPAGETVQFKAGTNNGYNIFEDHVTAVDASGAPVSLTKVSSDNAGITFSFTMPASEVTITANFTSYAPDVYFLDGELSHWDNGTMMNYDVDTRKYTLRVYFSDEYGYFRFRAGNNSYAANADGDYWPISENGSGESHFGDEITLKKDKTMRFRVPAGIYDIEAGRVFDDPDANNYNPNWWGQTTVKVTKVEPTLTFTPAVGEILSGTPVSVSSDLYDLLHAINPDIAENDVTNMVKTNGDYAASVTLTAGATVTGRAKYGNIEQTADAVYTIHAFDTETPDYTEAFSENFGKFFADNNTIWTIYNSDCARASAYFNGAATASESWLYSPYIDLTNANNPKLSFSHAGNFFKTDGQPQMAEDVKVMIREFSNNEWRGWTALDGVTYPDGGSYTFVDFEKLMTSYVGKTIQIAFKYTSTIERAGTWEIKDFKVAELYNITCNTADNGSITASPNPATAGETVTITVSPATGYELATLVYNDGTDHDIKAAKSFTMPAANVTVTATFEEQVISANDFQLVTDASQIKAGYEYIILSADYTKAMSFINTSKKADATSDFTISDDHLAVTAGSAVNILTLRNGSSEGTWMLQQNSNDKYIYLQDNNTDITEKSATGYSNQLTITIENDNLVKITNTNTTTNQIIYSTSVQYFGHYKSSNLSNNANTYKAVYLYYRAPQSMTLANLCKNGTVNNRYTISDQLIAVDYSQVDDNDVYLWCKDQGNTSIYQTEPKQVNGVMQIDYVKDVLKAQGSWNGNQYNARDWDQSNWVALKLSGTTGLQKAIEAKGHAITGSTITGKYVDAENYTIEVTNNNFTVGDAVSYSPNVYCPVNFLVDNLNINNQDGYGPSPSGKYYFFMNPKIQEVAHITQAVWDDDNSKFVIPEHSAGFEGEFTISFDHISTETASTHRSVICTAQETATRSLRQNIMTLQQTGWYFITTRRERIFRLRTERR